APSRAKVTAVALPLPQPGPIDPAPTTIAVLPLSRPIDFFSPCKSSFPCSPGERSDPGILVWQCSRISLRSSGLRIFANAHRRDVDGIAENIRQCPTLSTYA